MTFHYMSSALCAGGYSSPHVSQKPTAGRQSFGGYYPPPVQVQWPATTLATSAAPPSKTVLSNRSSLRTALSQMQDGALNLVIENGVVSVKQEGSSSTFGTPRSETDNTSASLDTMDSPRSEPDTWGNRTLHFEDSSTGSSSGGRGAQAPLPAARRGADESRKVQRPNERLTSPPSRIAAPYSPLRATREAFGEHRETMIQQQRNRRKQQQTQKQLQQLEAKPPTPSAGPAAARTFARAPPAKETPADKEKPSKSAAGLEVEEKAKAVLRLLAMDAEWQKHSNSPYRGCPGEPCHELFHLAAQHCHRGQLDSAVGVYRNVLSARPGLHGQMRATHGLAIVCLLMGKNAECIKLCDECLQMDRGFKDPYLHKARAFRCIQQFDNAIECLEQVCNCHTMDREAIQRELHFLRAEQRERQIRSEWPDHSSVLEVSADASQDEVTKAFRAAALKWHPDRWVNKSDADRKSAAQRFASAKEAAALLSDPVRRDEWRAQREVQGKLRTPPHLRNYC